MPTEPPTYGNSDETAVTPVVPGPGAGSAEQPTYGTTQPAYGTTQPGPDTEQAWYGAPQPTFGQPSGTPYGSGGGYGEQPSYGASSWGAQGSPQPPTYPYGAPTGPGGAGGATGYGPSTHGLSARPSPVTSFLSKILDRSFTSFVTSSIATGVYTLAMVLIVFGWLGYAFAAFEQGPVLGLLVLVVVGPLAGLACLVAVRVVLEVGIAVTRLSEDVRERKLGQDTQVD